MFIDMSNYRIAASLDFQSEDRVFGCVLMRVHMACVGGGAGIGASWIGANWMVLRILPEKKRQLSLPILWRCVTTLVTVA